MEMLGIQVVILGWAVVVYGLVVAGRWAWSRRSRPRKRNQKLPRVAVMLRKGSLMQVHPPCGE